MQKRCIPLFLSLLILFSFLSCTKDKDASQEKTSLRSVALFIPGQRAGSPIYDMLAIGLERLSVNRKELALTIIEAGSDQSAWQNQLTALAASGKYELIVSSNPALPALADEVTKGFPSQHFLIMDSDFSGNPHIATFQYDQREQAWLAGYLAGLAATGAVEGLEGKNRIALIAGQEYPAMDEIIAPWFLKGAQAVAPDFTLDFRTVGNWYDATRAAELARSAIRAGSLVLMPIAGGANQGVVQAASEEGAKVIWFDDDGFDRKRGTVIGSAILYQDRAVEELVKAWLDGELHFGQALKGNMAQGYIDFIQDNPVYLELVHPEAREKIKRAVDALKDGADIATFKGIKF